MKGVISGSRSVSFVVIILGIWVLPSSRPATEVGTILRKPVRLSLLTRLASRGGEDIRAGAAGIRGCP